MSEQPNCIYCRDDGRYCEICDGGDESDTVHGTDGRVTVVSNGGRDADGSPRMLSRWTFEYAPARSIVREHIHGRVLNACAGKTKLQRDLSHMATSETTVLNLYAGIGGNRKLWENVDVTAVEWDDEKAEIYRDHFPDDTVIVTDAHEYLLEHFNDYDFIWASPPCPTHSRMRKAFHGAENPTYPDMKLYQEVLLLKHHADADWVVENVNPYYEPLIDAQKVGRHLFWSNFHIPSMDVEPDNVRRQDWGEDNQDPDGKYGFDVTGYGLSPSQKRKVLNNCVRPEVGKHIFESRGVQTTLV